MKLGRSLFFFLLVWIEFLISNGGFIVIQVVTQSFHCFAGLKVDQDEKQMDSSKSLLKPCQNH